MLNKKFLHVLVGLIFCVTGCNPSDVVDEQVCGDLTCSLGEDADSCPRDCGHTPVSGKIITTTINSEGIGEVAVLLAYPSQSRFSEGAGLVVIVPPFLSEQNGFTTEPDFTSIGLIQVSFLWPGAVDEEFDLRSDGVYDFGGETAIKALRDVLRFTTGRLPNVEGRLITTLMPVKPMVDEVGIFSFAHAGIATTNVVGLYGSELDGLEYLVGYENPTLDPLTTFEAGYMDDLGFPRQNPFYQYPASFSQTEINLNYGTIRWDPSYRDDSTSLVGRPYLDLDGNALLEESDFIFRSEVPVIAGKRYYSSTLTQSLLDNGSLTIPTWPSSLALPDEASAFWSSRRSVTRYMDFVLQSPDLKVMLVFANKDHAQAAADKPHIHQAFQGFRFASLLRWVRLNPDRAYLQQATGISGFPFPDNPANTQPEEWLEIGDWAFDGDSVSWQAASLAALAEMSDRAHTGRWDENLGSVLYSYSLPTPAP